jgi:hypothetical protein
MAHEAPGKHGKGHGGEYFGPKAKEAFGVGAFNAAFGLSVLATAGVAVAPWMLGAFGLMGAGSYAIGARNRKGDGGHH